MRVSYYIINRYYYLVILSAALATRICMCVYMYAVERGRTTCTSPSTWFCNGAHFAMQYSPIL